MMGRLIERNYEADVIELRNKAKEQRRKGRTDVADCLDHLADMFQLKVNQKNLELYQR
jgi:hypothetical protein